MKGDCLQDIIKLACTAGEAIMSVYSEEVFIRRKEDDSPLTQADIAAHELIINGLQAIAPDIPIISEESAQIPYAVRQRWHTYWLVDPLDGTREFIKRNGEFTVNIALVQAHRPILGVVYAPAIERLYFAEAGRGAFRKIANHNIEPIQVRTMDPRHLTVASSRSHGNAKLQAFLMRIGPHECLSVGSSLKTCLVAEGSADLYPRFGPTSEWDTAAAQCVLEQAGGYLVDTQGQPLCYNTKESLLNPDFFAVGGGAPNWSEYLA